MTAQTLQLEKQEFTVDSILLESTGETDCDGEWVSTGNYEIRVSKLNHELDYHFCGTAQRLRSGNKNTTGWVVKLYLNMFYGNGRDILVLTDKVKTLKAVKEVVFKRVNELQNEEAETASLIEDWKHLHAKPIFAHNIETGDIELIGTSYKGATLEKQNLDNLWFNQDVPDYKKYNRIYQLGRNEWNKERPFYASEIEFVIGGWCSSSYRDEESVNKMVCIAKQTGKYGNLFVEK